MSMELQDVAVALEGHEHEIKSLKHRMDAVEEGQKAMNELATSVKLLAEEQKNISEKVDKIDKKMTAVEGRPAERWENMVDKVIWLLAGAAIIAFFAQAGIAL